MKVEDIMSRHLVTVGMDDTLRAIRRLFQTRRFHHLMVVEEGRLRGVLSWTDVLRLVRVQLRQAAGRW